MSTPRVDVYEDAAGEWRWRLVAGNGETIADSSEGYDSSPNAERALNTARVLFTQASTWIRSGENDGR